MTSGVFPVMGWYDDGWHMGGDGIAAVMIVLMVLQLLLLTGILTLLIGDRTRRSYEAEAARGAPSAKTTDS